MKKLFKAGIVLLCSTIYSYSQISTYSPYTRYGVGKIIPYSSGKKQALGGIGVGYRSQNHIDPENPASYSSQDTLSFIFDIGVFGEYLDLETSTMNNRKYNFYFNHLTLGFPITRWLKTCVGIKPYSYVGYNIKESIRPLQNIEFDYFYLGSGGINQFFIGNSIELAKKLSIGYNINLLFGGINQTSAITTSYPETFETFFETSYAINGILFNYGIQYYQKAGENLKFTVGLSYYNEANLELSQDTLNTNKYLNIVDTLKYSSNTDKSLNIPAKIGLGCSMEYKEKVIVGFDYMKQDWSSINFRNESGYLSNSQSYHLGIEYTPDKYSVKRYSDHIQYRIGAHYSNLYLNINGEETIEKGISLGIGLPFKNSNTKFNLAFEYGERGSVNKNLIKENYFLTTFNITIYDFWFFKRKID